MSLNRSLKKTLIALLWTAGILAVFAGILDMVVMPMVVQKDKITTIPDVTGLPLERAQEILTQAGVHGIDAERKNDKKFPIGTIISQNPSQGSTVKVGRNVYLTVSGGEPLVTVPSIEGRSVRDAAFTLERYKLRLGEMTPLDTPGIPENVIVKQFIAQGVRVPVGSPVAVLVSSGAKDKLIKVPDISRKPLSDAQRILLQHGLTVGRVTYQPSPGLLPNTVVSQLPRPGEALEKGKGVDLFVAEKTERLPPVEN